LYLLFANNLGMLTEFSGINAAQALINGTRDLLQDATFTERHRTSKKHFTRRRALTFMNVIVFLLQKSVRSVQLHLHSLFAALGRLEEAVTASAWSQGRMKLRHTAFIELNERTVLEVVYHRPSDFEVRRWRGHRLLGIDSSLVRLPANELVGQEFGWVECKNTQGACGRYPQARLSALTDLLNRIVIEAKLVPWGHGERGLAVEHLRAMAAEDLGLLDRGYASYELFAQFQAQGPRFVCRCPKSSFAAVNQLFRENVAGRSVITQVRVHHEDRAAIREAGLPEVISLRLVTVRLSTGELEVLATNLLDQERYPTSEFGPLYHCRWGIETYYGLIKGRLDLERFTGRTPEAIRQDVFATVFLSNLESVLTRPSEEQLRTQSEASIHPQQVNHAVSFHAIKSQIIPLLLSRQPVEQLLEQLRRLFLANPVSIRPQRKVPRRKQSAWRSYHYQRNTRKAVF
jgi:hypothetical protein